MIRDTVNIVDLGLIYDIEINRKWTGQVLMTDSNQLSISRNNNPEVHTAATVDGIQKVNVDIISNPDPDLYSRGKVYTRNRINSRSKEKNNAHQEKSPVMDFPVRVETDENPGWKWDTLTYDQIFAGKKVIVFGLPGAYTPTCTTNQLPGYEAFYEQFKAEGIDEIFCCSVNDTFVMNSWFREVNVEKVKPHHDGTGKFTRQMGSS